MSKPVFLPACLLALLVVTLNAAPSWADVAAPPPKPAAADNEGFVPEQRPANMTSVEAGLPAGPLVATAYGFIWTAVLVYVGLTARRTRQLEQEIALLAERLPAGERAS